jgi:hypothetical protein
VGAPSAAVAADDEGTSMERLAAMNGARFRMVVVRLLEVAVALVLAVTALELWGGYRIVTQQPGGPTGMLQPDASIWAVLVEAVTFLSYRGPMSLLFAAVLLLGATAVLAAPGPVAIARVLRWEMAGLGAVTALLSAVHLTAGVARLVMADPEPGGPFDSRLIESGAMVWAAAVLVLLAAFLLWWLRLGAQVEDLEEEPVVASAESEDPAPTVVEQIEAAERPETLPRVPPVSPDGSTDNGYDEFFRRR